MSTTSSPAESVASTTSQEVRQFLGEYLHSVERHDLSKFLSFFIEGEHFTVFEDREVRDWKAFVAFAQGFFEAVADITFNLERCSVDAIAPGVAVATGVFSGAGRTTSGEDVAVRNVFTFVLLKHAGVWRIRHVHESSLGASASEPPRRGDVADEARRGL